MNARSIAAAYLRRLLPDLAVPLDTSPIVFRREVLSRSNRPSSRSFI
jgi:hypothetical protein